MFVEMAAGGGSGSWSLKAWKEDEDEGTREQDTPIKFSMKRLSSQTI